jgi:hypothetical protein
MPEHTIEQDFESTQVQPDELDALLARLAVLKDYKDQEQSKFVTVKRGKTCFIETKKI